MPMIEPVSVMSDAPARAIPKSVTFARPSSSTITLCGLMSRWTIPRRWAKRAGAQDLDRDVDRPRRGRAAPSLADELLERAPVEVLHRDVVGAVPLAAVEDADDVRVLQAGGARGLAAEALDELGVLGEAAVEQLERDLAAELRVLGAVDVGHPARAEPAHAPGSGRRSACRASTPAHSCTPATPGPAWRSARRPCRPCRPARARRRRPRPRASAGRSR